MLIYLIKPIPLSFFANTPFKAKKLYILSAHNISTCIFNILSSINLFFLIFWHSNYQDGTASETKQKDQIYATRLVLLFKFGFYAQLNEKTNLFKTLKGLKVPP